jgi:hypothetical protein
MSQALTELGIENKVVQVIDNNFIDREVHQYRPTHVFIEAFWVVPSKFDILKKLHPTVKWIVRNHSKMDFLAHEGGMMGWAIDYLKNNVVIASNSPEAYRDMGVLGTTFGADPSGSVYLPNYYSVKAPEHMSCFAQLKAAHAAKTVDLPGEVLHIGCFGAIRPLKNHVHQALAAIEAAERLGKALFFYVNGTRVEGKADSMLRCLREIFSRSTRHRLIEMPWMSHEEFLEFSKTMDAVVQVSMSETFNIVAADAVSVGVPVLVSNEIPWANGISIANPHNVQDIADKLIRLLKFSRVGLAQYMQLSGLKAYCDDSKKIWQHYILGLEQHTFTDHTKTSSFNRILLNL